MEVRSHRIAPRPRNVLGLAVMLLWACTGSLTDVTPVPGGAIASISVNPSTATVAVGSQVPLTAVATDADGKTITGATVIWTVRDPAIASVSPNGMVQGLTIGSTQVAASANGRSGVGTITVQKTPVSSVVVRPSHIDASVGGKTQLTAVAYDASLNPLADRTIIWTSSDDAVATVDAAGNVTARAPGSATITGTAEGKSDVSTITVTQAAIATVAITPNPLSMSVGQTTQLTVTARDSSGNVVTGRPVTWTTSDPALATVSASGVVTAVAAGNVTIAATSDGKGATAALTVSNFAVGDVSVAPQTASIVERASTQLTATIRDVTGAIVTGRVTTWSSSNAATATVSSSGLVTGVFAGTVTITATSEGKSGTAVVTVTPAPVATVTVTPTTPTVTVGQTATLTATLKDAGGITLPGRVVTWSSSNTATATVSNSGVVTAVAPGTTTITATSEGKSGSAQVTVVLSPVAGVSVSPPPTLLVGHSATLSVVVNDVNGAPLTGRVVTWKSSDAAVVAVTDAGVVTGVAPGSASITATSEGRSTSITINVTPVPVGSVSLPATLTVVGGQTATLSATVKDADDKVVTDRPVLWSSDNSAVATVSSSGVVRGVASGTATITATSEGKSGSTSVTVLQAPVASVTLSPPNPSIVVGQTTTLTATPLDAGGNALGGRTVTWSSSTPSVATVSSSGVVTGVSAGSTTITAAVEGQSANTGVTVSAVPAASVAIAPSTANIVVGQNQQLIATVKDANGNTLTGRAVTWSSSAPGVATVSAGGLVTGVAPGSATITATSGSASGTSGVTVAVAPVAAVALAPASPTITVGQTTTLVPTLTDANGNVLTGRSIAWSSGTPGVATVSSSGVVTGVAAGSATITATSEGKSGTATVTVNAVPAASVAVTPPTLSLTVGQTSTLSATVKDANGNTLTGRTVTWSSGAAGIASVSSTGVVTALATGTAVITATSGSASGTSTVTVTQVPVASVSVSPPTASVTAGQTVTLTATTKDANGNVLSGRVVAWSSGSTIVATVSPSGVVTAVGAGTATITATSEGQNGTATITVAAVPAANVVVTPPSSTLSVGQTTTLTATVQDANGNVLTGRPVTWTSGTPSVATVSSTGVVTAIAAGNATITAASGSASGSSSITVSQVPVATVTLAPPTANLSVGQTATLVPTMKDANGNVLTGRAVTWSSSAPGVATVSATGVVTAVAAGNATITATSEGKNGTSAITVSVVPVATVTISPQSATGPVGMSGPLTVTLKDANGNVLTGRVVTWSSSNPAVVTVTQAGVVTAVAPGTATITATSEGKSGTSLMTVTAAPVASVTVTPPTASVTVGQTTTLTATTKDAGGNVLTGRVVTWSSSNNAVATVSSSGVVTAVAPGTAVITATSEGQTGSASITSIQVPVAPAASVTVAPPTMSLTVGQTGTLTPTVKDANGNVLAGRAVTWTSSTPAVATVSSTGVVTAVAPGGTTITATSGSASGTSSITVTPVPVASVAISPLAGNINVGQSVTLSTTLKDANGNVLTGRVVTWSSSVPGVATVSSNGTITGVAAGTTTITATSEGQSGTLSVTVVLPPVATVSVTPNPLNLATGQTGALTATLRDASGNVLTGRGITWNSSAPGVATVSSTGVVTGVTAGTATITATSEGKSGGATVTVTVPAVASVTVTPNPLTIRDGGTGTLTATVRDADGNVLVGRVVTWSSQGNSIAMPNSSGVVSAKKVGSAVIVATCEGKTGTSTVVVVP